MDKKVKELRQGIRLNIKKPPKTEVPKNIYSRRIKHKKGLDEEKFRPFFICSSYSCLYSMPSKFLFRISLILSDMSKLNLMHTPQSELIIFGTGIILMGKFSAMSNFSAFITWLTDGNNATKYKVSVLQFMV